MIATAISEPEASEQSSRPNLCSVAFFKVLQSALHCVHVFVICAVDILCRPTDYISLSFPKNVRDYLAKHLFLLVSMDVIV